MPAAVATQQRRFFPGAAFSSTPIILVMIFASAACGLQTERRRVPPEVETSVNDIGNDIASERYEKIYHEADDLWRRDLSLEQSTSVFQTVRQKLGKVENRELHAAAEQQNTSGPLAGRVFILTYQTRFERGEGMETFTFIQRNHEWLLARYLVSSTALK